ncbi:MAG: amidohydrolase family protein, partial [Verrucomicrobia bacterium]|nr:amidohydrolase family protein [Verrucomicrobiota bacterium]
VLFGIDPEWIWEQWMICLSGKKHEVGGPMVAPHSVYSVVPGLLKRMGEWIPSRHPSRCVSLHLSESREEFDYFASKSGAMWDWLSMCAKSAVEPLGATPFEHLVNCGIPLRQVLMVHGNFLLESELKLIASEGGALVHCPRSHEFFAHDTHPVGNWERYGVMWGLGTDSLATVLCHPREGRSDELDLLAEVRALKRVVPGLSWERLMAVVTSGAATLLGVSSTTGTLAGEKRADFNFMPLPPGDFGIGPVRGALRSDFPFGRQW